MCFYRSSQGNVRLFCRVDLSGASFGVEPSNIVLDHLKESLFGSFIGAFALKTAFYTNTEGDLVSTLFLPLNGNRYYYYCIVLTGKSTTIHHMMGYPICLVVNWSCLYRKTTSDRRTRMYRMKRYLVTGWATSCPEYICVFLILYPPG